MKQETSEQSRELFRLVVQNVEDFAVFAAGILFTPEDREQGAHVEEMRRAREDGRAEDERWQSASAARSSTRAGC